MTGKEESPEYPGEEIYTCINGCSGWIYAKDTEEKESEWVCLVCIEVAEEISENDRLSQEACDIERAIYEGQELT